MKPDISEMSIFAKMRLTGNDRGMGRMRWMLPASHQHLPLTCVSALLDHVNLLDLSLLYWMQ